jgi:hypothetical protein
MDPRNEDGSRYAARWPQMVGSMFGFNLVWQSPLPPVVWVTA